MYCGYKDWLVFMSIKWLRRLWHRRPGTLLKKIGMLVLGAFKSRLEEKVKKTIASDLPNTDLLIIPGGMTSQLQTLDVVVNKPKINCVTCMGNGCCLGTSSNTGRKI
jgi:hypothetical protein